MEMIGGTLKNTVGGAWLAYVRGSPRSPHQVLLALSGTRGKGTSKIRKKNNKSRAKEMADVYLVTCNGKNKRLGNTWTNKRRARSTPAEPLFAFMRGHARLSVSEAASPVCCLPSALLLLFLCIFLLGVQGISLFI